MSYDQIWALVWLMLMLVGVGLVTYAFLQKRTAPTMWWVGVILASLGAGMSIYTYGHVVGAHSSSTRARVLQAAVAQMQASRFAARAREDHAKSLEYSRHAKAASNEQATAFRKLAERHQMRAEMFSDAALQEAERFAQLMEEVANSLSDSEKDSPVEVFIVEMDTGNVVLRKTTIGEVMATWYKLAPKLVPKPKPTPAPKPLLEDNESPMPPAPSQEPEKKNEA